TRQQNEAAQKEIERLKALLANKEKENAAASAAPAAKPAAAAVATAAVAPAPAPKPAANATGLRQLASSGEVVSELQALALRVPSDVRRAKETNEIVYFKLQQNGGEAGKSMATLKALGAGQFRGRVELDPG